MGLSWILEQNSSQGHLDSALHRAAALGNSEIFAALLEIMDFELLGSVNEAGYTVLMEAIGGRGDYLSILKALGKFIDRAMAVSKHNGLFKGKSSEYWESWRKLASMDSVSLEGDTAMSMAYKKGKYSSLIEIMKLLIKSNRKEPSVQSGSRKSTLTLDISTDVSSRDSMLTELQEI